MVNRHTQLLQRAQRGQHIRAGQQAADAGLPFGQAGQYQGSVRDRFIPRHLSKAGQPAAVARNKPVRRLERHNIHHKGILCCQGLAKQAALPFYRQGWAKCKFIQPAKSKADDWLQAKNLKINFDRKSFLRQFALHE